MLNSVSWDDHSGMVTLDFGGPSAFRITIPTAAFELSGSGTFKGPIPTSTTTSKASESIFTKWQTQPSLAFGFAKESLTLSSSRRWDSLLLEYLGVRVSTQHGSTCSPTAKKCPWFSIQMRLDAKGQTVLAVSLET
jgi:hypothetical protein